MGPAEHEAMAQRPTTKMIGPVRKNRSALRPVVICGGGETGYALARELAPHRDLYVIDADEDAAARFDRLDVQFVRGNGLEKATLEAAAIHEADTFIACTGSDEVNFIACLTARRVADVNTFCIVDKQVYMQNFSVAGDDDRLVDRFIWPVGQLADDIARVISVPGALDVEFIADGAMRMLEYRLDAGSPFVGKPLSQLSLPTGVLIVAAVREHKLVIPRGSTALEPNDKAVFIGTRAGMAELQGRISQSGRGRRQNVVIIGGGSVGLRVAGLLPASENRIRLVEANAARCVQAAAALEHVTVLEADGTDVEVLEEEGLLDADVFVVVTDNDEKNLLASLLAKQLGVKRVITRANKPENVRLFERFGVDVALDPHASAVRTVVHAILAEGTRLLALLQEGLGVVIEVRVPQGFVAKALSELKMPPESLIVAARREKGFEVPRGDFVLRGGTDLIIFCACGRDEEVRDFFSAES